MADTERQRYAFVAKPYMDGTPWIFLQYEGEDLSCLESGFLGLDVKKEYHKEVHEIVAYLNERIEFVTFTPTGPAR